jgi:hypothetical protein
VLDEGALVGLSALNGDPGPRRRYVQLQLPAAPPTTESLPAPIGGWQQRHAPSHHIMTSHLTAPSHHILTSHLTAPSHHILTSHLYCHRVFQGALACGDHLLSASMNTKAAHGSGHSTIPSPTLAALAAPAAADEMQKSGYQPGGLSGLAHRLGQLEFTFVLTLVCLRQP